MVVRINSGRKKKIDNLNKLRVSNKVVYDCFKIANTMKVIWGDLDRSRTLILIFFMKRQWYKEEELYDFLSSVFSDSYTKEMFLSIITELERIKLIERMKVGEENEYRISDLGDFTVNYNEFIKSRLKKEIGSGSIMNIFSHRSF